MQRFVRDFRVTRDTRVLDIGGTPENWRLAPVQPRLVLLNMPRAGQETAGEFLWVAGDGRALPFHDAAFDVVFSNSVIEHVGPPEAQRAFAREAARVGRGYYVQTPNRWFPVEHHLLTPFVHYLPERWQAALVSRFSVWQWVERPSPDRRDFYIRHYLRDIRLLSVREMRALFPGARIIRERFLGLTKSIIAEKRVSL